MITFPELGKKNNAGNEINRLGNQLFQIAATIAHAKRVDAFFAFPDWKYRRYFRENINEYGIAYDHNVTYSEDKLHIFSKIPRDCNLALSGFFQSERYFIDQRTSVLDYFQPMPQLESKVRNNRSFPVEENSIAVHVRRKDYLGLGDIFHLQPRSYYDLAMKNMERALKIPLGQGKYVFFSDDIDWCKKVFGMQYSYSTDNDDITDLFTMAMFKHHIIANSSFSWWGSYLKRLYRTEEQMTECVTIAPAKWFNPESGLSDKDICPADWIKI